MAARSVYRRWIAVAILTAFASITYARTDTADLWQAYERKDIFFLRDHIPLPSASEPKRIGFLRAVAKASFGEHAAAVSILRQLLPENSDHELDVLARTLLMREDRAIFHYAEALSAIQPLLPKGRMDMDAHQNDLRNSASLLAGISTVPPEVLEGDGKPVVIKHDAGGRFPVAVNGHALELGFDTGASFSFLAVSTAKNANLKIRHIDLSLGSSTGVSAESDVAVGDVEIGALRIRNVVFLILPDAGLTMSDGFFMPGLLGAPVISILGAIRYAHDGSMQLGAAATAGSQNLALDGNQVLVPIQFGKNTLVCRLDTGADNTVFYEPFYRRFPKLFTDRSRNHALKLGGVSGAREIPAYRLNNIEFMLAGRPIRLSDTNVLEKSIAEPGDDYLTCNIGMDVLRAFGSYVIDLKHLRLNLGDSH